MNFMPKIIAGPNQLQDAWSMFIPNPKSQPATPATKHRQLSLYIKHGNEVSKKIAVKKLNFVYNSPFLVSKATPQARNVKIRIDG
jgi:hypothetical protein